MSLEQQDIELFGFFGLNEGGSEEHVGDKNAEEEEGK